MARGVRAALFLTALLTAQATMADGIRKTGFVTADGVRLSVLEACPPGTASRKQPAIGLVPGWSMPASIWRAQLEALGATRCVYALDPRGQGESEVPESGYEIGRRAEDIREFVARRPGMVLVGWSLGALEALEYVRRHGSRSIRGLVLVDSSVGEEPPPPPGGNFLESLRQDRRAAIETFVRDTFRTPRPDDELAALVEAALRMPLEASLSLFPRTLPREHWRRIAHAFPKPLLYVVTPQFAEQAQSLKQNRPGTRIEVFEEAGHALFADEPARFNALIAAFADELTPPARAPRRKP